MSDLKTLKDIGNDHIRCSKLPMLARSELKDELRQEAIKWVKDLQFRARNIKPRTSRVIQKAINDGFIDSSYEKMQDEIAIRLRVELYGGIEFAKRFFDLSEEDLK